MKKLLFALVVAAAAAGYGSGKGEMKIPLFAADAADTVVVWKECGLTPKGRRWNAAASADLTNVLSRVAGRAVPLYLEGTEPADVKTAIYLGDTAAARAAGLDAGTLKRGSCRIKTVPGKAYLLANCGMGASYAVTVFLDCFADYRSYLPGDGNPVTVNPDWTFPTRKDFTFTPAIYHREVYHGMTNGRQHPEATPRWMDWSRRLMAITTDEIENRYRLSNLMPQCHSSFSYLPPEKYFKDHPEWYSMVKGVRQYKPIGQLCMTNPEVREECHKALKRFIAQDRTQDPANYPGLYDLTHQDNMQALCQCPECLKVIAKYNRVPGGHEEGGDAGLQFDFINDIARRIAKDYPDVFLRVFAYSSTETPPGGPGIRPEKNVVVWYCDAYNYSDHDRPLAALFNRRSHSLLTEWLARAPRLQLWDYALYGNRTTGAYPDLFPDAIAADARLLTDRGLESIFMETEYHDQPFYELNFYLLARYYADPNRDPEKEIRDFCRVYGKGADAMARGFAVLRDAINANPPSSHDAWRQKSLPWRSAATYRHVLPEFEAAHTAAERPCEKARIARALSSTWRDLAQAYKTEGVKDARYAAAKRGFLRYAPEAADGLVLEREFRAKFLADARATAVLMDLTFKNLPPELTDVPESELVCVDHHKFYANPGAEIIDDPDSETGRAVVYLTGKAGKFPLKCGVYDADLKTGGDFEVARPVSGDEKYHWYKLGDARIGRIGNFWFPRDWKINAWLRDYYTQCDGLAVDPNWYEVWVSFKVQGPLNISGSVKPDGLFLDRLVFRRKPRAR